MQENVPLVSIENIPCNNLRHFWDFTSNIACKSGESTFVQFLNCLCMSVHNQQDSISCMLQACVFVNVNVINVG